MASLASGFRCPEPSASIYRIHSAESLLEGVSAPPKSGINQGFPCSWSKSRTTSPDGGALSIFHRSGELIGGDVEVDYVRGVEL